jgi:N4-gp56 family major capsid protein
MAAQTYSGVASRNLIRAAQGMLEHAMPIVVLGDFGDQKEMPKNSTDTLVFRRTLPFGALTTGSGIGNQQYVGTPGGSGGSLNPASFVLTEGTTPSSNSISFQDVSVTLVNYGILFQFSSKVEHLYEDDIPAEMQKLTGETLGEILEIVRYGVVKAGTNVLYTNGASRSAVNTAITLNKLRAAARVLESNRAKRVTQRLAPSVNYATRAVQPAYIVFCHTDCESDVRNLAGFTKVEEYGSFKPIHEREIGAVEQFRFITSPLLVPFAGAGSTTLNGMVSVGAGTNVDVYPYIVIGESAWGQVALKGMSAITPRLISSTTINHANPLGMTGYVGAQTWFAAVRLNDAWMARIEAGVTAL